MSYFDILNNYHLETPLLLELLSIYQLMGHEVQYTENLGEKKKFIEEDVVVKDATALLSLINIDVSNDRIRLILTKDSKPRTKDEQKVANLKKCLINIRKDYLVSKEDIISTNILDIIEACVDSKVEFNKNNLSIQNSNFSARYHFNNILEEYNDCINYKSYEPIIIGTILVMMSSNIKPYTKGNEIAVLLLYYISLLKANVTCFNYVSFFELMKDRVAEFNTVIARGSTNFDSNTLFFTGVVKFTLNLLSEAYKYVDEVVCKDKHNDRLFKGDHLEHAILYEVDTNFTKKDLKTLLPEASESTIMRALTKLKEKGYIMPLGEGRNASWMRIVDTESKEFVLKEAGIAYGDDEDED